MSCNACGDNTHTPQTPFQKASAVSLCAPGLAFTTNDTYLNPFVGGVPAEPVDLEKLVKAAETDTRLRFDPETCALHYTGERASNDCAEDDIVMVPTMLSCASIRDLGDVADTPPANDGDILVWQEDAQEWTPYTIPTGTANGLLAQNDQGEIVKVGEGSGLGCVVGGLLIEDSIDKLVGVNDDGCLVTASGGVNCFIGRNTPAGGISTVVGVDASGCLVKDTNIIDRINGIDGRVWGACNVNLPLFSVAANFGPIAIGPSARRQTFSQFNLPDIGCPYKALFVVRGYTDLNPHVDQGKPFHLNLELAIDNPNNVFTFADQWHDTGVPNTVNGWSESSSSTATINTSGGHAVYMNIFTDIANVFGNVNNLRASMTVSVIMVRQ